MEDSIVFQRAREKLGFHTKEAERLEAKAREHREQVEKHQAFLDVWRDLAPDPTGGVPDPVPGSPFSNPDLSQLEAARLGLELIGQGAGATEIAQFIMGRGFPYDRGPDKLAASLRGVLAKAKDDPDSGIEKLDYGAYGLRVWSDSHSHDKLLLQYPSDQ